MSSVETRDDLAHRIGMAVAGEMLAAPGAEGATVKTAAWACACAAAAAALEQVSEVLDQDAYDEFVVLLRTRFPVHEEFTVDGGMS